MTYSCFCSHSHPLCGGDAAGSAFLPGELLCAGCAGCMRCHSAGSLCKCCLSGLLHTCREMVQCCTEHLFASRRSCFTCSDILPLVLPLYPDQLRINCFNIWILRRYKQLMSLQGSEKSGLRSSTLHGVSSALSRRCWYVNEETCNSDF